MFKTILEKLKSYSLLKEPLQWVAIVAQVTSIIYSFDFFYNINIFFATLIVLFEATLFIYIPRIKLASNKYVKLLMVIIVLFSASFSILGVVSNGYNFILDSNSKQFKDEINPKYEVYKNKKENIENEIAEYKKQINELDLSSQTNQLKSWEDKGEVVNSYNNNKSALQTSLNKAMERLSNLKQPNETRKLRIENKGYSAIFQKVEEITKIKQSTLILILTFIIAIILQLIIFTARIYKTNPRTLKDISKTSSRTLKDISKTSSRTLKDISKTSSRTPKTLVNTDVEAVNVLEKIPEKSHENKENILENQNVLETSFDVLEKSFDILGQIKDYLRTNYTKNDNVPKFQKQFKLSEYEYKKIRDLLIKEKIIYTKNRRMYYSGKSKIKIVK